MHRKFRCKCIVTATFFRFLHHGTAINENDTLNYFIISEIQMLFLDWPKFRETTTNTEKTFRTTSAATFGQGAQYDEKVPHLFQDQQCEPE